MSSFEFLSVLISVSVALGMVNLLTGIGRLLHRHETVQVSITFLAWLAFVFIYMIIYWWTVVFGWQDWQNWNLLYFVFVLLYGIILYLLSVIIFPTDMPSDWDPHCSLMNMRHWFFGTFVVLIFVKAADSYLKGHLAEFSTTVASLLVLISQITWVSYQLSDLEWSLAR